MIQKELKTIKSFGSQLESTVTMEDIAAKEKKLKIRFPEALKELYLTFHPEDPLFSGPCSLLPFEELKLPADQAYLLALCPAPLRMGRNEADDLFSGY